MKIVVCKQKNPGQVLKFRNMARPTRWGIVGAGRISHDFVMCVQMYPKEEHEVSCNPPTFKATGDKGSF